MRLEWKSRQGIQSASNNDALAVGKRGTQLVCMLVDAAAKSGESKAFANDWAKLVVTQLLCEVLPEDNNAVIALLRKEQSWLRENYLLELGSYCLLCLDTQSRQARLFHVGDCLAGEMQDDVVVWWTNPHTLDRELPGCSRHKLTRSLNARRFSEPGIQTHQLAAGSLFIMATDGYWAECLEGGCPFGETQDDASYVTLQEGAWACGCESDTDNMFMWDGLQR